MIVRGQNQGWTEGAETPNVAEICQITVQQFVGEEVFEIMDLLKAIRRVTNTGKW